jgi:hypothetical protein
MVLDLQRQLPESVTQFWYKNVFVPASQDCLPDRRCLYGCEYVVILKTHHYHITFTP